MNDLKKTLLDMKTMKSGPDMTDAELKELERILVGEEEIQPMIGFSTRVMRAVHEEAKAPESLDFPWKRFLPGVLFNLVLLCFAAVWMISQLDTTAASQLMPGEWLAKPHIQDSLWASLTLIGTGILTWTVTRWSMSTRVTSF